MRLTAILLLAGFLQVTARTAAQTVTYSAREIPLVRAFSIIEKQTGYVFFYDEADLQGAKPVSIRWKNTPLAEALDSLLAGQSLAWQINGKIIAIARKQIATEVGRSAIPAGDIRGRVVDSTGSPIAGASVLVKGTQRGAATDAKGEFVIKGVEGGVTLVVTYTGYEPRQYKYSGQTGVTILLERSTSPLDQIQVIAYGTTTQRFSTGNISTVKSEDIEKQPVDNPLLALEGRVPGLFITQANGLPGAGVTVRVEGQNSISGGNDPLYVVDGVPYPSQLLTTTYGAPLGNSGGPVIGGVGSPGGNPLNYINPSDIESMEVLKDADATAIYGSRAANGAILITTKKGKAGQTKIDVNMQNGWGRVTKMLNLLNTQQYLQMRNEAKANDNSTIAASDYDLNGAWDTTRYTDWQKELIGGTAQYADIQSSVSGGTANTNFLVGAGYHRETTVSPGDFADKKGELHFNLNSASANQKFKLQLSGSYMVDNNRLPGNDLTPTAIRLAPNAPALRNKDGSLNWAPTSTGTSTWSNPLAGLNKYYQNKTYNLFSNAVVSYQVLRGLEIKSSFGYTNMQVNEFTPNPLSAVKPESRATATRSAIFVNNLSNSWIAEPQLHYNAVIRRGRLDVLLGTTIQQNNSNGQNMAGLGFLSDAVMQDIRSASSVQVNSSLNAVYRYNAAFGRINCVWEDKYIIDLTGRRDGSSRFGSVNQFHDFGSVGLGWIFSQEEWIRKNLRFLSFGKLKGSYGTTGNDQIGDYQFMDLYSAIGNVGNPYQGTVALLPNGIPNPYLQWEETRKWQVGANIGVCKDFLTIAIDYDHNRSSNELLPYSLPVITGFGNVTENFPATVENTSWEFSVLARAVRAGNFAWSSSINVTIPQNKLIDFPNLASSASASVLVIGQPVSILKAFHSLGVDPTTGKFEFSDKTGKTTFGPDYSSDRTVLINTLPKFYGGFENSFSYKGFYLDVLFQFVSQLGPRYFYNNNAGAGQFNGGLGNQPVSVLNRWQKPGDIAPIEKFSQNTTLNSAVFNERSSDYGYSDASYIRLKNLSLSWRFPDRLIRKAKMQYCQLYLHGQNLVTITNFKGLDPENRSTVSLPLLRILTIGVRIGI
ncbi:MAG TPA: SusC/RagA family TonB-linked outer membrane protein [Puia sp.]|nr:SusC/RagA family TonB-linked outer membrane protein [Puia sp.]